MRWCSLCNGDLTLDLVDELGGEEGPRVRARLVSDGILVTKDGDESDTAPVTFAHPALAKVARASIDPTAIAGMHARIAALLEQRRVQPGAHVSPVALARHREAAGAERPAARAWLEAAASFMSRGAYSPDEALRAYGKVLALCREASDGEGFGLLVAAHEGREELARAAGAMKQRRAELLALRRAAAEAREPRLIARALTRQARYKLETAGTDTERDTIAAVRAARRAGDPRTEGEARWVLAVYLGQLGLHREALGQLDAALTALGSKGAFAAPPGGVMEDSIRAVRTLRIEVLLSKSALLRQLGEEGAGLQAVSEAYAIAAGYGPRRLLGAAYDELGMACFAQGGYADALRFFRAAIAVDREVGGRERLGVALAHAGTAWAALGETERALAFLRRALAVLTVMKRYTTVAATVEAHVAVAELLVERNDIEGAATEIESARTLASATGIRKALLRVARGDAVVHLARRQYRLARSSAEVAEQGARESGLAIEALHGRVLAAEAAAGQGDRLAAWRLLGDVLEDPHFADPARVARGDLVLASCVRAFAALGDEAGAAHLGARLDALRRAVAATAPFRSRRETGNDGVGGLEHP
jgi:tetratricopeptide (TPR) repeat protein